MTTPTLRLKIEGPPNRISAVALARVLTNSLSMLDSIGRAIASHSSRSKAPIAWYVTKLESASAIAVLIGETITDSLDPDLISRVGNSYVNGIRDVENANALPRYMSDSALDRLNEIATPLGKSSAEYFEVAWVNGTNNEARMTTLSKDNLKDLRKSRITSIGSVTGVLDALSLRHGNNKFQVYDDVSARPVTVDFPQSDLERVKEALGARVVVSGTLERNVKGQPMCVVDPTLSILPEGRPLTSIIGVAPDFLGDNTMQFYMENIC